MYIPRANEEKRIPVMWELMAAHPLAAVVTMGDSGLFASHVPLVHEDDGTEFGVLKGHISRANSQWKSYTPTIDALVIFAGPQHYISASWYPGKLEHGEEVPTWNYAVVHASGPLLLKEDAAWLMAHLEGLTDQHEAGSATPWKVSDAPKEFIATLLRGIIGFELPIRKLEGKWKVSQNRDETDRLAVVKGLEELGTPESLVMRGLVERK
jgi:transcriptional regulator